MKAEKIDLNLLNLPPEYYIGPNIGSKENCQILSLNRKYKGGEEAVMLFTKSNLNPKEIREKAWGHYLKRS